MVILSEEQFSQLLIGKEVRTVLSSTYINRRLLQRVGEMESVINAFNKQKLVCKISQAWRDTDFSKGMRPIVSVVLKNEQAVKKPDPVVIRPAPVVEKPVVETQGKITGVSKCRTSDMFKAKNGVTQSWHGLENVQTGDLFQVLFTAPDDEFIHVECKCTKRIKDEFGSNFGDKIEYKILKFVSEADLL